MPDNPAGYPISGKKTQTRPNPRDYLVERRDKADDFIGGGLFEWLGVLAEQGEFLHQVEQRADRVRFGGALMIVIITIRYFVYLH